MWKAYRPLKGSLSHRSLYGTSGAVRLHIKQACHYPFEQTNLPTHQSSEYKRILYHTPKMEEPNKRKQLGWGGVGRDGGGGADTTLEKCHQTLEGNGKNNKFSEG